MGIRYVVAMDPGESIGLAWGAVDWDGDPEAVYSETLDLREMVEADDDRDREVVGTEAVVARVMSMNAVGFVSEDFILSPGRVLTKAALIPVRIEAMVRFALVVADRGWVVLKPQTPSQAKGVITDSRLKALGLWRPGRPHENDARRHLALLWRRIGSEPELRRSLADA